MEVVTYSNAYVPGDVSLCAKHSETHEGLGQVQHGTHDGECEDCARADLQEGARIAREQAAKQAAEPSIAWSAPTQDLIRVAEAYEAELADLDQ